MITNCPKCNSKVFNNKGVSTKNGKPYENYKCSNKSCGWIEWVDLRKPTLIRTQAPARSEQLPQTYDYQMPYQPPTVKAVGDQIIVEILQSIQADVKSYYKELSDQNSVLLRKVDTLERQIMDSILGESPK
jgi:hypothetical protein